MFLRLYLKFRYVLCFFLFVEICYSEERILNKVII